jgi:hypothetical protein
MNVKKLAFIVAVALTLGVATHAQDARPYIGVRLDPSPLPDLLTKHLGLRSGQGIRIRNVNVASPADKAGLERDDIIVRFQDRDVADPDRFVEAVQAAGVGTKISLGIIHMGQPKTLEFELEALPDKVEWKYPPEPEIITSWRPGRFWQIGPDGREWMEIPFNKIPEGNLEIKRFFNQLHTYHHSTDGEDYTITIEGDPTDEGSTVTVQADDTKHSTTVGQLDKLPEEYREPAREAIDSAKKSSRRQLRIERPLLPQPPEPDVLRRYFRDIAIPRPNLEQWSQKRDQMLEKLAKQMEQLQQRIEQLERRQQEALQKLLDQKKEDADDGEAPADPASLDSEAKPIV